MTIEQKQYIEQNIDLIEGNRWKEFFKDAPPGTGAYLYSASIDFMSELKNVPFGCFSGSNINNVTIPDGVKIINRAAFSGCRSLTSITIPDSITSIDKGAFYSCESLKSIDIPNSVTSIGENAFNNCSSLKSVTIPSSVYLISDFTFNRCICLTSVTIPDSVTRFGVCAFDTCTSLRTVNFTGTVEQWRNITDTEHAFKRIPAQVVICSDGIIDIT